ncbi:hypothetical protein C5167_012942, partial [Papaver somniferum]
CILIDRVCCFFMQCAVSRHRTMMNITNKAPVSEGAFVAPSASIIGDVRIGKASSIWYGCVLRGDVNYVSVGSGTNIQDNCLVHVGKTNRKGKVLPTIIGNERHSAVLHGCTVEDESFAGALVRHDTRIPSGEVWGGNPAKFLRMLTEEEKAFICKSATSYSNLAQVHAAENAKGFERIEFEKALRKKQAEKEKSTWVLFVKCHGHNPS